MIAEISGLPSSVVPVRAVTVTTEVMSVPELVMKAFAPSRTHSPPSRTALVRVAPASEPASGSVRPKPASARPATRSGRKRSFWASVPYVRIGLMPRPTPAESVMPIDWSTRPSSSMAMHRLVKAPPSASSREPPYCSGTTRPNSPRSPIRGTRSVGKWCSRSQRATCGSTASVANSRTTVRKSSWSLLSSNICAPSAVRSGTRVAGARWSVTFLTLTST